MPHLLKQEKTFPKKKKKSNNLHLLGGGAFHCTGTEGMEL